MSPFFLDSPSHPHPTAVGGRTVACGPSSGVGTNRTKAPQKPSFGVLGRGLWLRALYRRAILAGVGTDSERASVTLVSRGYGTGVRSGGRCNMNLTRRSHGATTVAHV